MAKRRTHSLEYKRSAVEASNQLGASIAGVAMAHGINANQLHKWRRQLLTPKPAITETQMLPVTITSEPEPVDTMPVPEGIIDIRFARASVSVRGQVDLDVLQTILATLRSR
ncbi:MAG: transposase [Betaproteobacteria bacterium]|nr:transposase [Betaproteobacteria bacterium]